MSDNTAALRSAASAFFLTNQRSADVLAQAHAAIAQAYASQRTVMTWLPDHPELFHMTLELVSDNDLYNAAMLVCKQWKHTIATQLHPRILVHLTLMDGFTGHGCRDHGGRKAFFMPIVRLWRTGQIAIEEIKKEARCLAAGLQRMREVKHAAASAWLLPVSAGLRELPPGHLDSLNTFELRGADMDFSAMPDLDVHANRLLEQQQRGHPAAPMGCNEPPRRSARPPAIRWIDMRVANGVTELIDKLRLLACHNLAAVHEVGVWWSQTGPPDVHMVEVGGNRTTALIGALRPLCHLRSLVLELDGLSNAQLQAVETAWLRCSAPALECLRISAAYLDDDDADRLLVGVCESVRLKLRSLQELTLLLHGLETIRAKSLDSLVRDKSFRDAFRCHPSLRLVHIISGGSVDDLNQAMTTMQSLPKLESLVLGQLDCQAPSARSDAAFTPACQLADFLYEIPQLRSLGVLSDTATEMYEGHGRGSSLASIEADIAKERGQPWEELPPGLSAISWLSAWLETGRLEDRLTECKTKIPMRGTSLWRELTRPTVESPWKPAELDICPPGLRHLRVFINSPPFSYLLDLTRACVLCLPRLQTLHLIIYGCTLPVPAIVVAFAMFGQPPSTAAGTTRLRRLKLCFVGDNERDVPDDAFLMELRECLARHVSRGGACVCDATSMAPGEDESRRVFDTGVDLQLWGVDGCGIHDTKQWL